MEAVSKDSCYASHWEQCPDTKEMKAQQYHPIENIDMQDPTDTHSSSTTKKLQLKIETISPPNNFFTIVSKNSKKVTVPKLNSELENFHQKSSSLADSVS